MFPSGNNIVIDTGCVRFMIILLNWSSYSKKINNCVSLRLNGRM